VQISTSQVSDILSAEKVGDVDTFVAACERRGTAVSLRHATRLLGEVLPGPKLHSFSDIRDANGRELNPLVAQAFDDFSRKKRRRVLFGQIAQIAGGVFLIVTDRRGATIWSHVDDVSPESVRSGLIQLREFLNQDFALVPHGELQRVLDGLELGEGISVADYAHRPLPFSQRISVEADHGGAHRHLDSLEAESIRIFREAVAAAKKPAMLFSMGKDSMAMWELAKKAFWPEPPPFPLVVIDTRWKFQDMYRFREYMAGLPETNLIVHINPDAIAQDVNPFDFGSATHTDITKTRALKQILDEHQFDFVFGGARRDEERSRAKERVFSVRNERHGWDPKTQRPELWNVYNTVLPKGHSMRVFPLSNWTELDVWRYIERENIPVVPLYFSKVRPFVERDGALIMVDDERFRLADGEKVYFEPIRFRTLGCYPLTGGVRSGATTLAEVIAELEKSRVSERSSRVIDFDPGASMEQKKKEGYF
jgi:sulfate adenylyltransferase subunit 2